jgi:hypothetical protein
LHTRSATGGDVEMCPEICPRLGKSDPLEAGPTQSNLALQAKKDLQIEIF